MNLVLVGYRGTGKTSVARELASRLRWDWVDADAELQKRAGRTIAEIFSDCGESGFRDLEAKLLPELLARERCIVSLGGGAVLREENRRRIISTSVCVWLTASPQTLYHRIAADPATGAQRPNLTASGGLPEIQRLLHDRAPFYQECARWVVDTEGKTPAQVAQDVLTVLAASFPDLLPDPA